MLIGAPGTLLIVDETTTVADWDDLSVDIGLTQQGWAEQIKVMATMDNGLPACPPVRTDDVQGRITHASPVAASREPMTCDRSD